VTGTGAALDEAELDGVTGVALEAELLDVQDDLGDIFLDARDRRELLVDVADLDARDRRPSSDDRRTRRSALPRVTP
jgi:hypothetical protein